MGWLVDRPERRSTSCCRESNRVQLIPVPPRRGWIIDRNGKPIAINRSSFRVDIIPQQLEKDRDVVPELARLLELTDDDVDRIRAELAASRGFQPVSRSPRTSPTTNMPRSPFAFPSCPGSRRPAASRASIPDGPAVAHLVGYVGTRQCQGI